MDRYSRQTLFPPIGPRGQERIRNSRVLIVGCGALGTHSSELLGRAGVGKLRLVDRDIVEWSNLHRQAGFEETHARDGTPKSEALESWLVRINSEVSVEARVNDFNFTNATDLSEDCDLLIDGTDNLPTRFLLNDVSYRLRIPWIYAGAIGGTAHVQFFSGEQGPCLRCHQRNLPPPGTIATCDTAGVIGPAAALAASWQAGLALRFLAQGTTASLHGKKALLEPWDLAARVVPSRADPECPVCAKSEFSALEGALLDRATVLCGRRAVQVLPAAGKRNAMVLPEIAARLQAVGTVDQHQGLLRFDAGEGFRLTLFGDGRAIFDGLTDPTRARSLYARFVGE
jgi:adenylyltransferase/sulfurtransferase